MDVYRLKELSVEERDSVLQGESLGIEEAAYMKPLSAEEISIKKDDFTSAAILKAVIEEELSEVKKQYKDKLEPFAR